MTIAEPGWLQRGNAKQSYVISLCAKLSLQPARARLPGLLGDLIIEKQRTVNDRVAHFTVSTDAPGAWHLLQRLLAQLEQVDVLVQPENSPALRLLVCDMDMTMVDAETLDEVAAMLGLSDKVAPITAAAMRGEIDFRESLEQRIGLLKGQPVSLFDEVAQQLRLMPGAEYLLSAAKASGMHCILVSGGFGEIAEPLARRLGFDEVYCNRLDLVQGRLSGRLQGDLVDAGYKAELMKRRSSELGMTLSDCCAIGDGANDRLMLQAAGLGIAYFAKPALRAVSHCQINHSDLETAWHFISARSG